MHHREHPYKLHDSPVQQLHQSWQKKPLQRVVKTAQDLFGIELPSLEHLHSTCCVRRTKNIKTLHTPDTICLSSSHQAGATDQSTRALIDWKTASSQKLWCYWIQASPQSDKTDMLPSLEHMQYLLKCHFKPLIMCSISTPTTNVIQHPNTPSLHICLPHLYCTFAADAFAPLLVVSCCILLLIVFILNIAYIL